MYRRHEDKDYGHGRIERRNYTVLPMMYFFKYKGEWRDLQAIVRVESERIIGERKETSVRYYITSLALKEYYRACQATREHWSVENTLHWKLDVGLGEDACQVTRGYADQNLATLIKMVLYLL